MNKGNSIRRTADYKQSFIAHRREDSFITGGELTHKKTVSQSETFNPTIEITPVVRDSNIKIEEVSNGDFFESVLEKLEPEGSIIEEQKSPKTFKHS